VARSGGNGSEGGESEEGGGPTGGGGGGGFGGGGLEFGGEEVGGEETPEGGEEVGGEEAPEVGGEEAPEAPEVGAPEGLSESVKRKKLLTGNGKNKAPKNKTTSSTMFENLVKSIKVEDDDVVLNERVKIYNKNLKINEDINTIIGDIDRMLDE
jgi:hypothetical protein